MSVKTINRVGEDDAQTRYRGLNRLMFVKSAPDVLFAKFAPNGTEIHIKCSNNSHLMFRMFARRCM